MVKYPVGMASLVTVPELAVWAQRTIASDDPFANAVVNAASLVVRDEADQPLWERDTAPERALLIAAMLAKRTYLNPNAIVAEGSLGPIGGDRYVEDFARTLELTSGEKEILHTFSPTATGPGGTLWVQPTTRGTYEPLQGIGIFESTGSPTPIIYIDGDDVIGQLAMTPLDG